MVIDVERFLEETAREPFIPPGWSPPRVLPPGWSIESEAIDGAWYRNKALGLLAALSIGVEKDSRAWLHASVSRRARVSSWDDLLLVKEMLLGDREAVVVMPPRARYVNIHPFCLHAFALYAEDAETGLPDFTRGTGSL